jgi:hypothetical protein
VKPGNSSHSGNQTKTSQSSSPQFGHYTDRPTKDPFWGILSNKENREKVHREIQILNSSFVLLEQQPPPLPKKPQSLNKNKTTYFMGNYLLTPWNRVLQKLTRFQLVKKFPAFYGTRRFITAVTSARLLTLS